MAADGELPEWFRANEWLPPPGSLAFDDVDLGWLRPYTEFVNTDRWPVWATWFAGGRTNVAWLAAQRWAGTIAVRSFWETDDGATGQLSFKRRRLAGGAGRVRGAGRSRAEQDPRRDGQSDVARRDRGGRGPAGDARVRFIAAPSAPGCSGPIPAICRIAGGYFGCSRAVGDADVGVELSNDGRLTGRSTERPASG